MSCPYCNVALPVPLRTLFTYAIPTQFQEALQPGHRVLVPFRKKSLVGVIVELIDSAPAHTAAKIREISKPLDLLPALTPKLVELAQWLGNYYVAPIGEVFRSMLPPVVELKTQRQVLITQAGSDLIADHADALASPGPLDASLANSLANRHPPLTTSLSFEEAQFLAILYIKKSAVQLRPSDRINLSAVIPRLQRRGLIELRENILTRERRTQRVVAWKSPAAAPRPGQARQPLGEKEQRVRHLLETERGALPLAQLLKLASVSRALIDRMQKDGLLESWEETIDPADDPFDSGYTPPAHELNPDQESAMRAIRARFELGEFGVLLLHGVTGSGKT
jgi:primosomal protein N' (replication factor Y) (superfamily II helicase)